MTLVIDRTPALADLPRGWPQEIAGVDLRVPVLDGSHRRYVNLDNAASTPPLVVVRDAVSRFAEWYSSVHRGSGFKSQLSTHVLESARDAVAEFVGADLDRQVVVFTKHTTEAINKMARDLAERNPIVFSTVMEHHANMLPWRVYASELRFIRVDEDGSSASFAVLPQTDRASSQLPARTTCRAIRRRSTISRAWRTATARASSSTERSLCPTGTWTFAEPVATTQLTS